MKVKHKEDWGREFEEGKWGKCEEVRGKEKRKCQRFEGIESEEQFW